MQTTIYKIEDGSVSDTYWVYDNMNPYIAMEQFLFLLNMKLLDRNSNISELGNIIAIEHNGNIYACRNF